MAMMHAEFDDSQTGVELIPGVENRVIVVLRVLFSSDSAARMQLLSDPGGTGEAALLPLLYGTSDAVTDVRLGRSYGVPAGRGTGVGMTSAVPFAPKNHSIAIWYEVVD